MSSGSTIAAAAPGRTHDPLWVVPEAGRLAYIDGVRAIAIIAVVAFHAHIPGFRGGFVGVDVFFVISGFLITQQIVSQLLAGRFSVTDFYARRVLRIFPPLLLVTVVTLAAAPLFPVLPQEAHWLANSAAATAAMVSNYYFTTGTEYFAQRSEIAPLLHTWSLGVEEQYYLLTPAFMGLIVALANRRKWDASRALLVSGAIAIGISYVALAILTKSDHRLAFFSIITRCWQFAAGGMLAIVALRAVSIPAQWRSMLGAAGLAAILASVALYHEHMAYPGLLAALPPTLGTVLLVASGLGNERAPLMRMLASGPAVTIGVLSYSWYLWHWPLTEFARTLPIGQDSLWKDIAANGIALLLSVPTYMFLERPMKTLRRAEVTRMFGGRIVAAGIAASAAVALAALALAHSTVLDRPLRAIELGTPSQRVTDCRPDAGLPKFTHVTPCVLGGPGNPNAVFWGDSHALMLKPVAEWSAQAAGQSAVVLGKTSCLPLQGVEVDFFVRRTCANSNDELLAWLLKQQAHPITGVVLAARWSLYNGQDAPDGNAELPRLLWADPARSKSDYATLLGTGLKDLLAKLSPQRRVLIVGPVPEFKRPPVSCLLRAQLSGQSPEGCAMNRADVERRRHDAMQVLARVASAFTNVRVVDPLDVFCDRDRCRSFGPNGVFYSDTDHLSAVGADMLYQAHQGEFQWVYGGGVAQ